MKMHTAKISKSEASTTLDEIALSVLEVKSDKNGPNMKDRLKKSEPYNVFFNSIHALNNTKHQYNSISFPDLLCPSLGGLKTSLQINFMVDIDWLMEQYDVHGLSDKPLTLVYGYETMDNMDEYLDDQFGNIEHFLFDQEDDCGIHHAKVGIYAYEDGSIRVVVSSANLYASDWNIYSNTLWVSPACPKMDDSVPNHYCAGKTHFKIHLLIYLQQYRLGILNDWIKLVQRADFSQIRVCLITSTRGFHYEYEHGCHLHRVGKILSRECKLPQEAKPADWSVLVQTSTLGSYGYNINQWLGKLLLRSLASHTEEVLPSDASCELKIIFPSVENVNISFGGGCLTFSDKFYRRQKWIKSYLHEWKADRSGRTHSMPHSKTYCRVSPCHTKLAWFLLTSANATKAGWGDQINSDLSCKVRNVEVGVLFLPIYFDEEYFIIKSEEKGVNLFPFMYDLPLTPYSADIEPFTKQLF